MPVPTVNNPKKAEFLADPRKAAFLEFLAKPKQFRGMNQAEFAASIQVTPQTLCEWKKLDGFSAELMRRVRENTVDDAGDIIHGLTGRAKEGDPQAVKLWMQYAFGWSEKVMQEITASQRLVYVITRGERDKEDKRVA